MTMRPKSNDVVRCPYCGGLKDVFHHGKDRYGDQRYKCMVCNKIYTARTVPMKRINPPCPNCGKTQTHYHGKSSGGKYRYHCSDCFAHFSSTTPPKQVVHPLVLKNMKHVNKTSVDLGQDCPKCGHTESYHVQTYFLKDGRERQQRRCKQCKHNYVVFAVPFFLEKAEAKKARPKKTITGFSPVVERQPEFVKQEITTEIRPGKMLTTTEIVSTDIHPEKILVTPTNFGMGKSLSVDPANHNPDLDRQLAEAENEEERNLVDFDYKPWYNFIFIVLYFFLPWLNKKS